MLTPDFETISSSFWLLYWSQYCDMPNIKGVSIVDRKPGASTDLGVYNALLDDQICQSARFVEMRMMLIDAGRSCVLPV